MRRLILFLIFVVNLHIACNNDAVGVNFGSIAYAQQMTYEAQTYPCEGDDLDPNGYYSSFPCEMEFGITEEFAEEELKTKLLIGDVLDCLSIPVSSIGAISSAIEKSAEQDLKDLAIQALRNSTQSIKTVARGVGVTAGLFSTVSTVVALFDGETPPLDKVLNLAGCGAGWVAVFATNPVTVAGFTVGSFVVTAVVVVRSTNRNN